VLSGRGLCDELITRPEESYRLCCVVVFDLETSRMGAPHIYDISRLRVNLLNEPNFLKTILYTRYIYTPRNTSCMSQSLHSVKDKVVSVLN